MMRTGKLNIGLGFLFMAGFLVYGFILLYLRDLAPDQGGVISMLALAGMLVPIGILSEVLFGLPPLLVIVGGISMVASVS